MTGGEGAGRLIGAAVDRREDPRMLTGRGHYVDDVVVPGMLHAAFVRSPLPHARITSFDSARASALDGVRAVFGLDDLEAVVGENAPRSLAGTHVLHVGDPVAVVVADSRALAEDGADLVEIDYEPLDAVIDAQAAVALVRDGQQLAGSGADETVLGPTVDETPGTDEVIDLAAHVVTESLRQHRYVPAPMETRGIVASWDPVSDRLTAWLSTQGAHAARDHLAAALGVATRKVRVLVGDVGGGFGLKIRVGDEETAIALATRILGRPVKWIEDRYENLLTGHHARADEAVVSLALDEDGRFLALRFEHIEDVGAYGGSGMGLARFVRGPYRLEHVKGVHWAVRTNTTRRGAYRGPWMFETVMREVMVDIAARRIGIDPLELRRRNVLQPADLPHPAPTGPIDHVSPAESLEQAAELIGYDEFRASQEAARSDGRMLGIGLAAFIEPSAMGFGANATDAVTLRVDPSGQIHLITGVNSQGHSIETTMPQVVAEHLGVELDDIVFVNGDTDAVPVGATTGGSRNAVFGGGAARQSALAMRERILQIASHHMEAAPEDLEITGGVISVRGTPTRSMTVAEVATLAYSSPSKLPEGIDAGLEIASRFSASGITYSNATHACTVEVDGDTGRVQLLRYVVSEDCGTIINPRVVEGQIAGGVAQGVGGVLLEHFVYDDDGNPLTTSFLDYLLPTATELPRIQYGHIETPSVRPGGFKGMGEGGAIGAPAAVINAVADALAPLGVVLTSQPLSPAAILDVLARAGR